MSGSQAWTWRHAFARADELPPMTKFLLHTIGMFMNELGEGCYPSQKDIMDCSGLDKKTIIKHTKIAIEKGWLRTFQHGYRGQKWKRLEYVACWPDRDLEAADPDDRRGEGGGNGPPPSDAEKVVDSGGEGGGNEGEKVVDDVHQDKTSPENFPITSPVEREGAREDDLEETGWSPQRREQSFKRTFAKWPTFVTDSEPEGRKEWAKLTDAECQEADERVLEYVDHATKTSRGKFCAFSKFISEKRWKKLPERSRSAAQTHLPAAAYGKLWGARRFSLLLAGHGPLPTPSALIQTKIDQGGPTADMFRQRHVKIHGWPIVNRMHEQAKRRIGEAVPCEFEALADGFTQLRSDSELMALWKAEHERRNWPWFEGPLPEYVWMPKGETPAQALEAFDAACRATGLIEN